MRISRTTPIEPTSVSFSDVDLFSEWEAGLGWDITSTQLSAGTNEIGFDHFEFPGLLVGNFCTKQSMLNLFAVPRDTVVFLTCRAKLPVVWNGLNVQPTTMAIVRPSRESWAVMPAGLDCYEFMVSEDLISRTEFFPQSFFAKTTEIERAFLPLVEPITGLFLRGMDAFFEHGRRANGSDSSAIQKKRFFDFIIDGLLQVTDAGLLAQGWQQPKPARRSDLVGKGRDFVYANLTERISADDIAQALGVSYRVLNYAFIDSVGMSPYQFILTQKLHAVRRELKSGRVSVAESCLSKGFGTPSRFTRQYVRLFGELPSETRTRISRRVSFSRKDNGV